MIYILSKEVSQKDGKKIIFGQTQSGFNYSNIILKIYPLGNLGEPSVFFFFFFFSLFAFFRAAPAAYGGSQARGESEM